MALQHLHRQAPPYADQVVAEDGLPVRVVHVYVVRIDKLPLMVMTGMIMFAIPWVQTHPFGWDSSGAGQLRSCKHCE